MSWNAQQAYDEALRRIAHCQQETTSRNGKQALDLSALGLTSLPPEIGQLATLTELYLEANQLTTLPAEIGQLKCLTELYIEDNQLSSLPPSIGGLAALKVLSLEGNRLTSLPPEIGQLTALTELYLEANQIATLPRQIGRLSRLTKLSVDHNRLTTLPPKFGQLTSLIELSLIANQLTALPPQIGQLTALTDLYLNNNQLTALPPEMGQLASLEALHLQGNQLEVLPPEIGRLAALAKLFLGGNRLTALPPQIGQLTGLTSLYLEDNQLAELPREIGQLTGLKRLRLHDNRLTTLPREIGQLTDLKWLSLERNRLTALPPEMGQLTSLTELYLHKNPGLAMPDSILGPEAIEVHGVVRQDRERASRPSDLLNFYFAQVQAATTGGLRAVDEVKVMLVGRGGAGKTSLRRFLLGQDHDSREGETPGVALDSFPLGGGPRTITVRLWDFAGQEVTHALHQFFLTEGCVYVLVLDPRSDTEMRDAEYWLGLLRRYASGAPVVIALNRQDARQGGYDVDRRELQEHFPAIKGFLPTNCDTREGCEELRTVLRDVIDGLGENEPPHLRVPKTWLDIMDGCAGEGKTRQHLTLDQFREICRQRGEQEPGKQESLARLLHKLGAVLHFVDEPRLRDTSVLNPHWVTDAVYRLLRYKDRPGSDGTLTLTEARTALPGETEESARFLLRLMERFEMCFPVEDPAQGRQPERWLIPGALDRFQPKEVGAEWQQPGSVRLRYVYDPLPEGVLPRFIVLTNALSEKQPRWRNGVVLRDGEATALVRRGEKRNHVEVTAFGPVADRLRLLEITQGNLERINADVPEPKPYAEQEISGLPGVFRRVADLEAAELANQSVAIKTAGGNALVQPTPQLNHISESGARDPKRVPLNTFLSYSHEDMRAKSIFQSNLTVMMKKNFITPWQDGLIEPGMLWEEEIKNGLEKMDLFVGLLTTAFLASDFIERVEIKAARARLQEKGRSFLFVLILVDDISLQGLDLAEYQILKPGGKAVSKHGSRKEGFDQAQKELERLVAKRQEERKGERKERGETRTQREADRALPGQEGVTILPVGTADLRSL